MVSDLAVSTRTREILYNFFYVEICVVIKWKQEGEVCLRFRVKQVLARNLKSSTALTLYRVSTCICTARNEQNAGFRARMPLCQPNA
jgi:hypothetical protein